MVLGGECGIGYGDGDASETGDGSDSETGDGSVACGLRQGTVLCLTSQDESDFVSSEAT